MYETSNNPPPKKKKHGIKKHNLPGNSAGDLFGMVKTWPFGKVNWPPTRGWKGHGLNHLVPNSTRGRNHINLSHRRFVIALFPNGIAPLSWSWDLTNLGPQKSLTFSPGMSRGPSRVVEMSILAQFPLKKKCQQPKESVASQRTFTMTRWWFQIFFIFTPNLGEDEPNLTWAYFSDGLKLNHQRSMSSKRIERTDLSVQYTKAGRHRTTTPSREGTERAPLISEAMGPKSVHCFDRCFFFGLQKK